ncbi:hypothetical protein HS088_TW04G00213 [Tripterygium wilfordii]|uniref:Uncharacterized protein n=1 Tax=Tripterygium wilfordii TaxID=458696 RepID=A0A7J7DPJ0_TRIWF|nr:hypothetical protein HS088_TW04G00213 [Tripterygium wilfordii]
MITCSAQKPSFSSKFDHLVESTRLSSVSHREETNSKHMPKLPSPSSNDAL